MERNKTIFIYADILLCVIAAFFFYQLTTWHIESAFFNGEYTPAFPDSFYHATRILDSVMHGGLIQFDPRIHAPEGAWISWPWGYDWFVARIINIGVFITGINPAKILVHIPPLWGLINLICLVYLCRTLNISYPYRIIAVLCFILLPLNQQLHLVGRVDHHFMELTMVLLSSALTLKWFQNTSSNYYALLSGIILGASLAIHTSLIVLQIPVIVSLIIFWTLNKPLPTSTVYFSISLFFSTLLFLLPSETFREGFFNFYFYSIFHLYVSFCVSLLACLLYFLRLNKINILIIVSISLMMTIPLIRIILDGYGYVSGQGEFLKTIGEVNSFLTTAPDERISFHEAIKNYSAYILFLPISLVFIIYSTYKKPCLDTLFITLFSLMAVFLMLKQMRFHYFGSFLLYLPIAYMFQQCFRFLNVNTRLLALIFLTLLVYWIPIGTFFKKQPPSPVFEAVYWSAIELKKQCEDDPGIILAPAEVGHYLTYFTTCSVIANSFGITPQDFKYHDLERDLFNMSSQELYSNEYEIKYIFIMREDNIYMDLPVREIIQLNSTLSKELILSENLPDNYLKLFEVIHRISNKDIVFARAIKIVQ